MKSIQGSVLVVDDDKINRDLLSRQLKRQGHDVTTVENGRRALDLMKSQQFDLVLLDIMMPEMDGYQMLEQLKADAVLRHIPVIMISAVSDLDSVVRCIGMGAEDYLFKPFNQVLLKARIDASLEKKRLRDEEQVYVEELSTMQRIDRELNDTLDVNRAMRITLEWAMRRSDADAGLVGVVEEDGVRIVASQGYDTELDSFQKAHLSTELPAIQKAIQSGQPRWLSAGGAKDGVGFLAAVQSQIAVPIRRQQEVIGMLLLESVDSERCTAETLAFLARLSDHAAIAISNAQLYAAVQAANIAKSDFVSLVAHELKTPMTSIKGHADLLVKNIAGPVNEAQIQLLNTIRSNVDRMAVLVVDLTDISRIEAGHLRLECSAVPITKVVEEVVRSTRSQIEEKEQTLILQIADDLPPVWGDRDRLIQVLTNLVSNAYKYTPPGGRFVIRAECMDNPKDERDVVHVAVQDNGIGISLNDQEKIFKKFFRSKDQKARQVPGTGLGLNIARYLVEMQGGRIWFESELRKGTTFHFTVPVAG